MGAASSKKKATSAGQWKKQAQGMPMDVPSGNTALVRPVGMQVFLRKGMIPNSLMAWVQSAIKGEEVEFKMEDFNEQQITDVLNLVDAVTCFVVVEPKVSPISERDEIIANDKLSEDEKRELIESTLWVDEVDDEDKMFIYQFVVGGTKDIESFRAQQAAGVESLRSGANVGVSAK